MKFSTLSEPLNTLLLDEPFDGVLVVTLNRPQRANAFTTEMAHEIIRVFGVLEAEPEAYRCVVLTASGDRAFCAGADLKERDGMSDAEFRAQHYLYERCFRAVGACPPPLIAALNGAAFAGGLEIALQCDFAYASETARFALTEVTRGIMPGGGGTQMLPRSIGERRAKELIFTGRPFSAAEAVEWGLVNKLCAPGTVLAEVLEVAKVICANAPISVRQAKKSISTGMQMDKASGMLFEIEAYYQLIPTEDRIEGINAYVEKRTPVFKGR